MLEHATFHPQAHIAILTLDAEKAFLKVTPHWLFQVLECVGIDGPILSFFRSMYSSPSARMHVRISLSGTISLSPTVPP